jgi:hypothetical protein
MFYLFHSIPKLTNMNPLFYLSRTIFEFVTVFIRNFHLGTVALLGGMVASGGHDYNVNMVTFG